MIDTHCHIDLYANPLEIVKESEQLGILTIGMTNLPSHFEMGFGHVTPFKKVRLALGMHPLYAEQHSMEFDGFAKNLSRTSYIGEVGLDFSKEGISSKETQIVTFEKIVTMVSNQKKLLSIHSRQAEREVLDLLIKYKIENAIFHWYSGPLSLIDQIIQNGYYFSINPSMIKSKKGQEIVKRIPLERILTESDGPFIVIHNRVIKPSDIILVHNYLSNVWEIPLSAVDELINTNFKKLLEKIK